MIKNDLLFLRLFGGKKMGNKRIADITADDVMYAYKRQIVAMVLILFVIVFLVYASSGIQQKESEQMSSLQAQQERIDMRLEELHELGRVEGQSPEYHDNISKQIKECYMEYDKLREKEGM